MKKENDGYIRVRMLCLFEILHKKVKKEIGPKKKKNQLEDNANAGRINKKTKKDHYYSSRYKLTTK